MFCYHWMLRANVFGRMSVCVSVCLPVMLTFESLELQSPLLVYRYIFRLFRDHVRVSRSSVQGHFNTNRGKKARRGWSAFDQKAILFFSLLVHVLVECSDDGHWLNQRHRVDPVATSGGRVLRVGGFRALTESGDTGTLRSTIIELPHHTQVELLLPAAPYTSQGPD